MSGGLDICPEFSIGVTTYDRREMLVECLGSIQSQSYGDFEVIVGNDLPDNQVSAHSIGVDDDRIRFLNNPSNLGEIGNMNSLLSEAKGRYFTWLADDDRYATHFLEAVRNAIRHFDHPLCVFTSYEMGDAPKEWEPLSASPWQVFKGRQFLRKYLNRSIETLGCYGVFETNYLRQIGGMKKLGDGFSPYSDNLLAIQAGLLDTVIYIDQPLVFFRSHDGSISYTSNDLDAYISAQRDCFEEAKSILMQDRLRKDFPENACALLLWFVGHVVGVMRRSGVIPGGRQVRNYGSWLRAQARLLRGSGYYGRFVFRAAEVLARALWAEARP